MDWIAQRLGIVALALGVASALGGCSDDGGGETDGGTSEGGGTTAGSVGESDGTSDSGEPGTTTGEPEAPDDPGTVILRRLNNVEYNNTIRDLIGTEQTPADNFPANQVSLGFDNISAVQSLSPLQAELYERAKEAGIEGRSSMTKDELEAALAER